MTGTLEIPFPPPHQASPTRMEPPFVPVTPRWEYREVVRESSAPPSEAELDVLGSEGWELAGVAASEGRLHFYFKRERQR